MTATHIETSRRAALGVAVLATALSIVWLSGAKVRDLRRFCARRGLLWEFAFSAAWVVLFTSSAVAVVQWVRSRALVGS